MADNEPVKKARIATYRKDLGIIVMMIEPL
jgi:hypothetical protein